MNEQEVVKRQISKLADEYQLLLIKRREGLEKSMVYVLSARDLNTDEREALESKLKDIFGKDNIIFFIDDLHSSQLKEVLEKFETVFVGDPEVRDAILAGVLTLSHDFRFFVNEKMNMMIKKRLKELIPSY